jgi:hypothetical protein
MRSRLNLNVERSRRGRAGGSAFKYPERKSCLRKGLGCTPPVLFQQDEKRTDLCLKWIKYIFLGPLYIECPCNLRKKPPLTEEGKSPDWDNWPTETLTP